MIHDYCFKPPSLKIICYRAGDNLHNIIEPPRKHPCQKFEPGSDNASILNCRLRRSRGLDETEENVKQVHPRN